MCHALECLKAEPLFSRGVALGAVLCGPPGGGPEILSVLLEGESLFNDASSLTLYEIFHEVVTSTEKTTLAHDLQKIVRMTVWSAFTGVCIGVAFGIITRWARSLG